MYNVVNIYVIMYYIGILLILFVSLENGLLLFIVIPPVFFCVTHLSMEVNAVCGLIVPNSSYFFFIFCSARLEGSHGRLCVNFMPAFNIYNEFFIITFSHI